VGARWPDANAGILTGNESGLLVIDLDNKGDTRGEDNLAALASEFGELPSTLTATTGKGKHLFFAHPGWQFTEITERLLVYNHLKCVPPLDEEEVLRIAGGVCQHPPETGGQRSRRKNRTESPLLVQVQRAGVIRRPKRPDDDGPSTRLVHPLAGLSLAERRILSPSWIPVSHTLTSSYPMVTRNCVRKCVILTIFRQESASARINPSWRIFALIFGERLRWWPRSESNRHEVALGRF
jgi:hypothetical protein